jgi:hypothetical protein
VGFVTGRDEPLHAITNNDVATTTKTDETNFIFSSLGAFS